MCYDEKNTAHVYVVAFNPQFYTLYMFQNITTFLKESKVELKKVTWPTRQETIRYTITVIIISGAVALFLGGIDVGLQRLLNAFIF